MNKNIIFLSLIVFLAVVILAYNAAAFCDNIVCNKPGACPSTHCEGSTQVCNCQLLPADGGGCEAHLIDCPSSYTCVDGFCRPPNCVKIAGVNYCCGANDNVCPEDYETPQGTTIDCDAIGQPDNDCAAAPTECNCSSCEDCLSKLNSTNCLIVKLNQSITMNVQGDCIGAWYTQNFNNKIFDCQNNVIDGASLGSAAISLRQWNNNTIKNCIIKNFLRGINFNGGFNNTLLNNTIRDCRNAGVLLYGSGYQGGPEALNNTLINNTILNNGWGYPEGGIFIRIAQVRNNFISYNRICNNTPSDFVVENQTAGNYGFNNTCDSPDGWNDQGKTGCTYNCAAPPTQCNITSAIIIRYCSGSGGSCQVNDKIGLNITVENMTKCDNLIVSKMEMYATTATGRTDGCEVNMINMTQIYRDVTTKTYYANWTVSVPSGCSGLTVFAKTANLSNASGVIATKTVAIPPGFGNFTFATITPGQLVKIEIEPDPASLTVPYTLDYHVWAYYQGNPVPVDVSALAKYNSSNITRANFITPGYPNRISAFSPGAVTVYANYTNGSVTKYDSAALEILSSGQVVLSHILMTPDYSLIQVNQNETYAVEAYLSNGTHYDVSLDANTNYRSSNTNVATMWPSPKNKAKGVGVGLTNISANYTRGSKTATTEPPSILNVTTQVIVPQCNIVTAKITKYCSGTGGTCKANDKIGLNISVEDMVKCTNFNINKIQIDASDSGQGGQGSGQGGMTGFAVEVPPSGCIVYMTNSTPLTILGNSFIANWTVSVSLNCQGKTVTANKAKIYNGTNHLVHNITGNFGGFTFAGQVGGCYCVYNNQQYSCGTCVTQTPYYCQDVAGQGQIIPKCQQCNNCPSVAPCNQVTGLCTGGSGQVDLCHGKTTNVSCHGEALCFWDKGRVPPLNNSYFCETCKAVSGIPKTCFDYKNESACVFETSGLDKCGIGPSCLNVTGYSIPGATNCKCSWNGANCTLNYTMEAGGGQHCNLNMVYGECDTGTCGSGKRDVTYDYTNQTGHTDCTATDQTSCQTCGIPFKPLPFFEWWNVIIVVGIIIVVYVFISKKR